MGDDYVEVVVSRGLVVPALKEGQERRYPTKLTQDEALELLWEAKDWQTDYHNPDEFLWADLVEDATMHEWNGKHPSEENTTVRVAPAATTVLVTVVSRFGDVGIRDKHLNPASYGYYSRVMPEQLTNWRRIPDDAPTDWEGPKELEARSNLIAVEPNRQERRAAKARQKRGRRG
jgi:hypothetical protein